jgi:nucleoside-diphosphate-sugar epimerase
VNILVTGASGFIGQALVDNLASQGNLVYALYRIPPQEKRMRVIAVKGDVLKEGLGIEADSLPHFDQIFHLAGIVNLGTDKDGMTYRTNVWGTENVLKFCTRHDIPHILFCSTAYTLGRNSYERSKALAEMLVRESDIPLKTIFKPSIVLGTPDYPCGGHFPQFVSMIVRVHRRAERIRRAVEGGLRLPVIRPVFRAKGNPNGYLNMVRIDKVAEKMAEFTDPGTYWLTNPHPPTLGQLAEWISRTILVDFKIEPNFKPTPIESQLARMVSAFTPYLKGDNFSSNINGDELTYDFIRWTINSQLKKG